MLVSSICYSNEYVFLSKTITINKLINNSKYLDIAVGAPNSEIVYVYKSYPVVKMITTINSLSQTLEAKDSTFNIKACWSLQSKYDLLKSPSKIKEKLICFYKKIKSNFIILC